MVYTLKIYHYLVRYNCQVKWSHTNNFKVNKGFFLSHAVFTSWFSLISASHSLAYMGRLMSIQEVSALVVERGETEPKRTQVTSAHISAASESTNRWGKENHLTRCGFRGKELRFWWTAIYLPQSEVTKPTNPPSSTFPSSQKYNQCGHAYQLAERKCHLFTQELLLWERPSANPWNYLHPLMPRTK